MEEILGDGRDRGYPACFEIEVNISSRCTRKRVRGNVGIGEPRSIANKIGADYFWKDVFQFRRTARRARVADLDFTCERSDGQT